MARKDEIWNQFKIKWQKYDKLPQNQEWDIWINSSHIFNYNFDCKSHKKHENQPVT